MLARDQKNVTESFVRQVSPFRDDLVDAQRDAQNRIITRETAVTTVVDALVLKIKWREEPHRSSKILPREMTRSLSHLFQSSIRFRSNQALKPV